MNALVIAPDADERAISAQILERADFHMQMAQAVDDALAGWSDDPADLIVLLLPTNQLIEAVRQIRQVASVPVLVVGEKVDETTAVELYDMGADLVLSRPYQLRLLMAQAKAMARRGRSLPLAQLPPFELAGGGKSCELIQRCEPFV